MRHGNVIPNKDGSRARCGGPGICNECSAELIDYRNKDIHFETSECWCNPKLNYKDEKTGVEHWVHNSSKTDLQ